MKVNEEKQFPIHLTVGWAADGALFGIICATNLLTTGCIKKKSAEAPKNKTDEKRLSEFQMKANWLETGYTRDHSGSRSPPCVELIAGGQN